MRRVPFLGQGPLRRAAFGQAAFSVRLAAFGLPACFVHLAAFGLPALILSSCAAGPQSASSPYCDDYARSHSRLYGVHYSIAEWLDDQDELRAWCMRNLNQPQP